LDPNILNQFHSDAKRLAFENIQMCGLKFCKDIEHLSDPISRWMDFYQRYIPPQPRKILLSKNFEIRAKKLPQGVLENLQKMIVSGLDINCYQSKGLIFHNDSSGKKRSSRSDLLWADWGIHHLHLNNSPIPDGKFFSNRSDWLLYAVFDSDYAAFVDIKHHREKYTFSDVNLMKIIASSWPQYIDRYELKGISPGEQLSSERIGLLRKSGVQNILSLNGKAYMGPGHGINTASTSVKVVYQADKLRFYVSELAKIVSDPACDFKYHCNKLNLSEPIFSLERTEQAIMVYEKKCNGAFSLPRVNLDGTPSIQVCINEYLNPFWLNNFKYAKKKGPF